MRRLYVGALGYAAIGAEILGLTSGDMVTKVVGLALLFAWALLLPDGDRGTRRYVARRIILWTVPIGVALIIVLLIAGQLMRMPRS
ncbi:hypothetical protein HN018_08505 [Lichenicola cladoniae]|uniref:Uncharacterized protein n=1 Tax=Lichenicola cladoniae TaxID=1484109 RepID=A0A6M8HP80_9PROT|nr:hypothetical protein [Lichenicola cladoniae]NPD68430.1 hypothetical protein [Acetobacteraceae bacterium]QKE90087.1 hypothetical protein HN018_08505 [Lichenicola cladoniae]